MRGKVKKQPEADFQTVFAASTDALPDQPFIGLVDGAEVPLLPVSLPKGLRGQARETVAMREYVDAAGLPQGAVDLRPFSAKPLQDIWDRAFVAGADQIAAWRARFEAGRSKCRAILPDYLSLPAAKGIWVIAKTDGRVLARLGLSDGFSADGEMAALMLAGAATPEAVLVTGEGAAAIDAVLADLDLPVFNDAQALAEAGFAQPRRFANGELGFDLMLDPRAAFDDLAHVVRAWWRPLAVGLCALAAWAAASWVTLDHARDAARGIRAGMVAELRSSVIPSGPILDIRAQVAQALAARQAGAGQTETGRGPVALFQAAAYYIWNAGHDVTSASYSDGAGLRVELSLPDFAALDALKAALEEAAIGVEIADSNSAESGGVTAALILRDRGEGG